MLNQESPTKNNDGYASYWPTVRVITFVLLALWLLLNFGVIFYARELSGLQLFGWPIPFYMAAQGTILIYLLIIGGYALLVNRLERKLARENESKGVNESALVISSARSLRWYFYLRLGAITHIAGYTRA
jgi:putative solute:sodium symporter small subunit